MDNRLGSIGSDIRNGVIWTHAQSDSRFEFDVQGYVAAVAKVLGTEDTSQNQFDALVSFHFNTGTIAPARLTRLHKQGRFAEAAREFAVLNQNDGKPMPGLIKRRADEARLYAQP